MARSPHRGKWAASPANVRGACTEDSTCRVGWSLQARRFGLREVKSTYSSHRCPRQAEGTWCYQPNDIVVPPYLQLQLRSSSLTSVSVPPFRGRHDPEPRASPRHPSAVTVASHTRAGCQQIPVRWACKCRSMVIAQPSPTLSDAQVLYSWRKSDVGRHCSGPPYVCAARIRLSVLARP